MRHFDSPKFIYLWRKFLRKIGFLFPRGRVFKIRNIFSARFYRILSSSIDDILTPTIVCLSLAIVVGIQTIVRLTTLVPPFLIRSSSVHPPFILRSIPYRFRIVSASPIGERQENDRRTIGEQQENDTGLIRKQ